MHALNQNRRQFIGNAAMTLAALPLATWPSTSAPSVPLSPIRPTAITFPPLKQINAGSLNVGYIDAGPAAGPVVLLLHGWPYDIHSYAAVAPLLTAKGYRVIIPYVRGCGTTQFLSAGTFRSGQTGAANKQPLPPAAELQWWYQFYFATERGALGYDKYRHDFGKLIWKLASPKWAFDDATFDRTAASFDNPDYVRIVIHNYRYRLGLAEGEAKYSDLEARIGARPVITVPSITLEGDANGAPHYPDDKPYRDRFSQIR